MSSLLESVWQTVGIRFDDGRQSSPSFPSPVLTPLHHSTYVNPTLLEILVP